MILTPLYYIHPDAKDFTHIVHLQVCIEEYLETIVHVIKVPFELKKSDAPWHLMYKGVGDYFVINFHEYPNPSYPSATLLNEDLRWAIEFSRVIEYQLRTSSLHFVNKFGSQKGFLGSDFAAGSTLPWYAGGHTFSSLAAELQMYVYNKNSDLMTRNTSKAIILDAVKRGFNNRVQGKVVRKGYLRSKGIAK